MTAELIGPDLPGLRCIHKLGAGGFSDVYLYEREHPRLKVAVKLLRLEGLGPAQLQMFQAEADTMAELAEHPFIVPVLGAGTAGDGRPYLIMQYYPPPDLRARVARQRMSVPEALRTGIQLASAIETAHRAGIIHRDIKPANVLVSTYGVPGLTDFGIAGRGEQIEGDERVGLTLHFAPPEVILAESNGSVASDVYSLAATVWNLLGGHPPFWREGDNSDAALMQRVLNDPAPPTGRADVPSSLDRVLQQAMARNPAHRPASAAEFARHLQRIEGELRLARTDLVVLDHALDVATRAAGGPDETVVKRPVTVRPTGPAPQPRTSTKVRRPSTPVTGPDRGEEVAADAAPEAGRPSPLVLGAVATGLVAVVVVVGVLLAGGGERKEPDLPDAPGPTSASDVLDDLAPIATPELAATPSATTIRFTASGMPAETTYTWSVLQPGSSWTPVQQAPDRSTVDVSPTGPGKVCAKVFARVGGSVTGPHELCQDWPAP